MTLHSELHGDTNGNYLLYTQLSPQKSLITLKVGGKFTIEEVSPDKDIKEYLLKLKQSSISNSNATKELKINFEANDSLSSLDLPKFDDELQLQKEQSLNDRFPPSIIPSIGSSDVRPTDTYPSTRPYIDPLRDDRVSGSGSGFNGMIVDKNHPIFGNQPGRYRNDGDIGHPFGARYDDPLMRDESVGMGLPPGSFRRGGPSGSSSFRPPGGGDGNPFGGFI